MSKRHIRGVALAQQYATYAATATGLPPLALRPPTRAGDGRSALGARLQTVQFFAQHFATDFAHLGALQCVAIKEQRCWQTARLKLC